QLLNFTMTADSFELPKGLRIRRMTNEEISEVQGSHIMQGLRANAFAIHEFCIEGESEETKAFGDLPSNSPEPFRDNIRPLLDRAILGLRTFKAGPVGYDYIQFIPMMFSPLGMSSYGSGDPHVPPGEY